MRLIAWSLLTAIVYFIIRYAVSIWEFHHSDLYTKGWKCAQSGDFAQAVHYFNLSCEDGNAAAFTGLGVLYEKGQGVQQDTAESVRFYRKGAELGSRDGAYYLANRLRDGVGCQQDRAEAIKWFTVACGRDSPDACSDLGAMYEDGVGVRRDVKHALRFYRKGAELGSGGAAYNLANRLRDGTGCKQNVFEAIMWYTKAGKRGVPEAFNNLGAIYEDGMGVFPKNHAKALRMFRKGATLGCAKAAVNLATFLGASENPKDLEEAKEWFTMACDKEEADAFAGLGALYEKGLGVQANSSEAVRLYREGAKRGSGHAASQLGCMLRDGNGCAQDYKEAIKCFTMACDNGYVGAYANLAQMHQEGLGVPKYADKAQLLYEKGAKLGDANAAYKLGCMLRDSTRPSSFSTDAIRWLKIAGDKGHKEASQALAEILSHPRFRSYVPY